MTSTTTAGELVDVGALDEFPVGAFRVVDVDGMEIGVLRAADGSVRAIRNRCPHQHAPICEGQLTGTLLPCLDPKERSYGMDGLVLRCPWHAYEFDVHTGRSLFGTYPGRLQSFDAQVGDGGRVLVRLRARG